MKKENEVKKEIKTKTIQASAITVTDSLSSVKLVQCAGGEIRPEIKVYDSDPVKAYKTAIELMDKANKKYKVTKWTV